MKIEVTLEDMVDVTEFAQLLAPLVGGSALQTPQQPAQQTPPPVQAPTPPQQSTAPPVQAPAQQVPTAAPSYTLEDLGRAGVALMDSGKRAEVETLVASFGVASLQQLPEAQYGAFATALRSMGAPI